jgi:hypothetical protein
MMGRGDGESFNSSVNFPEKRTRKELRNINKFTGKGQRRTIHSLGN